MKRYATMFAVVAAMMGFYSCGQNYSLEDSAIVKVFMPQTVVNGGIVYNEYEVPVKNDPDTRRHIIDPESGELNVILGVKASGNEIGGFQVNVSEDSYYSQLMLSSVPHSILLPSDLISLPETVSVPSGDNEAVFYMSVDLERLKEEHSDWFNRKLLATVQISEPTAYELNESRSRTVVILDGRTFIPQVVNIAMPQATVLNGGVTDHYPVPLDDVTQNYSFDEKTGLLTIPLSVKRDGEEPFDAFSVDVSPDAAYAQTQLASIDKGVLLPEGTYSLSTNVATVRDGHTEAVFDLMVDVNTLVRDYPQYAAENLVMSVKISSPTLYELDENADKVTIIVNAKKFYPKPEPVNLVKGGKFDDSDAQYWTCVNSDGGGGKGKGVRPGQASVRDGVLKFTVTERCFHSFYQKVTIPAGAEGQYQMKVKYYNKGGTGAGGRVFCAFATSAPVEDATFDHSKQIAARAEGSINTPWNDDFMGGVSQKFNALTTDGLFNLTSAGDYYFILGVEMWSGTLEAYFDDVKLYKYEE